MGVSGQCHAPAALYPQGRDPLCPLNRTLGGTHSRSRRRGQRKKKSAPVGDGTPIIHLIVRHCTDWANRLLNKGGPLHRSNFSHLWFGYSVFLGLLTGATLPHCSRFIFSWHGKRPPYRNSKVINKVTTRTTVYRKKTQALYFSEWQRYYLEYLEVFTRLLGNLAAKERL
jgi:hypothetical protein